MQGSRHKVTSIAFSPDGKTLASGSSGSDEIILWNLATRQNISQSLKGHTYPVMSIAFSPDGKMLASGSCTGTNCDSGEIILWNILPMLNTRLTMRWMTGLPLEGHTGYVSDVKFSPDGQMLASGGGGKGNNITILWDISTRERIDLPLRVRKKITSRIS
jgi:WD40 repeat protein